MIQVLIVEDDPMVAEFNRRYLEKVVGYQLHSIVASVEEAFEIVKSNEIDLILLDIYMPQKNGWDLLNMVRRKEVEVDIIVISASCDTESIKKALRYGVIDYLIKPFEFDRFYTALCEYRTERNMIELKNKFHQKDLDSQFFQKHSKKIEIAELPKGLTRNTLSLVWTNVKNRKVKPFSTDELAMDIGISRVSLRKYLQFLNEIHIIKTEVVYGKIGRPVYKHIVTGNDDGISGYL
ncbi:response regulator [Alkalihalobacillus sp. MEB130]|uniref:response regulator n=1 Tax=Alkalihalobacillus sp. MEB130 TaxID=2976704 RepID=UPI0028DF0000|nr:response regulator [Alkalihalobacillus sp. MEB130]MDT8860857.1 response regulator [Alkalihalobacillus sp. MEB130]